MYFLNVLFFETHFPVIFSESQTQNTPSPRKRPQDLLVRHYDCEENEQKKLNKDAINQVTQCQSEPLALETTNIIATFY